MNLRTIGSCRRGSSGSGYVMTGTGEGERERMEHPSHGLLVPGSESWTQRQWHKRRTGKGVVVHRSSRRRGGVTLHLMSSSSSSPVESVSSSFALYPTKKDCKVQQQMMSDAATDEKGKKKNMRNRLDRSSVRSLYVRLSDFRTSGHQLQ